MKIEHTIIFMTAAALLFACAKTEMSYDDFTAGETAVEDDSNTCFELGVANIYLAENLADAVEIDLASGGIVTRASSEELNSLYSELGIVFMERIFPDAGEYESRTRREGLHRWYRVTYDKSVTATKAADDFSAVPGIEIAEPVRKIKLTSFNDPYLSRQWHYYNDGSLSNNHRAGCDINVTPVWENYTTGSRKVIVSVVDEGIDYTHEDLAANYVGGFNFCNNTTVIVPGDHGSHTSGTIAAVNNNGTGVCGIAGGDYAAGIEGCGLLSCQIFMGDDGGNSANAIKYGADNGAVISQNSWGYVYDTETEAASGSINSADKAAVDYFIKYAGCDNDGNQLADSPMKGGVVIFAAGNDAWAHGWPAEYDEIIAVGAVGPNYSRAYYSNYGDWVDICAPGGDANYSNGMVLSCETGNQYAWMQGTSMACPHVSGVAALVVSYCGGPGFTAEYLKEKLINGANSSAVSANIQIGNLVDALGAMTYGSAIPPQKVTSYTVESNANNLNFTWNVTRDSDDVKAYGYVLMATTDADLFSGIDLKNIPSGISYTLVETGELGVGDEITGTLEGLLFSTDYYVAISGYDYAGNYSELSDIKSVTTKENDPPVISTTYTGDYRVSAYQTLSIPYTIEDPNGHTFTVMYTTGSAADSWTRNSSASYTLRIEAPLVDEGSYTATITATDSYGAVSTQDVTYTILENSAPEIVKQMEDMFFTTIGERDTFDLTEYVSDPDGETLSWDISNSNSSAVYVNIVGSTMNLTTVGYGSSVITITGTDAKGKSVQMSFNVMVSDGNTEPKAYPNPVSDILYVSILTNTEATFVMHSSTGAKVYEATENVSAFRPAEIDVSGFAPGRYTLTVSYNGMSYDLKVTKI